MAVDAVLAVADLETRDVNFELIKMLTKVISLGLTSILDSFSKP